MTGFVAEIGIFGRKLTVAMLIVVAIRGVELKEVFIKV